MSQQWKSQAGFVWSLIGSAVGFANILSFSAQVYKNGGGAFLIPYCIALFLLGIPFLILEGIVGFRTKSPLVTAYGQVWGARGKTLGWLAVLSCLSIGGFYIVLTGYSVAYTYFSAVDAIPQDTKSFFVNSFLQTTSSITDFGQVCLPIFIATCVVALLTWFVLIRNVKDGIERVCSIFMPVLVVIMTAFAIVASFLPGGLQGWLYYLRPDFSKLLEASLWRDVFGQLFFSLSLGLGIVIGYSRHTGQKANIARAMCYVALGDFAVSFISGAAIMCCLAHISAVSNIPFTSILTSDSTFEIGFIIFPQILKFFGPAYAQILGVVFFFCVFIAGITGVFSIVESIAGNIEVEFGSSRKRAVTIAIAAISALALVFCMGNASHLIEALVPMVIGTNMLIGGLGLIFAFQGWIQRDALYLRACLCILAPILLVVILSGNLMQEWGSFDLSKAVRWSWFFGALLIASTLAYRAKSKEQIAVH